MEIDLAESPQSMQQYILEMELQYEHLESLNLLLGVVNTSNYSGRLKSCFNHCSISGSFKISFNDHFNPHRIPHATPTANMTTTKITPGIHKNMKTSSSRKDGPTTIIVLLRR